jgi:hypothetical protein
MSVALRRRQLRDFVKMLAEMSPEEQRERIARLGPAEMLLLDTAFEAWAHDAQLPPTEKSWRTWLMMAGRGFGKTRAGAEWIYELGWQRPVRIALVGATIDEARRVMVEGASGLLSIARRCRHKMKWEPSKGELTWLRGSVAHLYSGDNADGLRGPKHHFAWCASPARCTRRRGGRGAAEGGTSRCACQRKLLYRCRKPDRRLARPCSCARRLFAGGVAVHRAGGGAYRPYSQ